MFLGISGGDLLQAAASVIGAVIAVCGVYWQVNKSSENDKKNNLNVAIALKNLDEYISISREIIDLAMKINRSYNELQYENWKKDDAFESKFKKALDEQLYNFEALNYIHEYGDDGGTFKDNISKLKKGYEKFANDKWYCALYIDKLGSKKVTIEEVRKEKNKIVDRLKGLAGHVSDFANKRIKVQ